MACIPCAMYRKSGRPRELYRVRCAPLDALESELLVWELAASLKGLLYAVDDRAQSAKRARVVGSGARTAAGHYYHRG